MLKVPLLFRSGSDKNVFNNIFEWKKIFSVYENNSDASITFPRQGLFSPSCS